MVFKVDTRSLDCSSHVLLVALVRGGCLTKGIGYTPPPAHPQIIKYSHYVVYNENHESI